MPHLPNEIIREILIDLPASALLRFRRVCKDWYAIIASPSFVQAHLERQTLIRRNHRLLFVYSRPFCTPSDSIEYSVRCSDTAEEEFAHLFHPPGCGDTSRYFRLVGSCNGLVCFLSREGEFQSLCFWNPVTNGCRRRVGGLGLSWTVHYCDCYGFGLDEMSDDYKVVKICDRNRALVYSVRSDSWKWVSCGFMIPLVQERCVTLNGCLHWLATAFSEGYGSKPDAFNVIFLFDMSTEEFQMIQLAEFMKNGIAIFIGAVDGSIAIVVELHTREREVWVMKEHGVVESWSRLYGIEITECVTSWRALGFTGNGKLLIENTATENLPFCRAYKWEYGGCSGMTLYDPATQRVRGLVGLVKPKSFHVLPYVESLVSLKPGYINRDVG